MESAGHAPTVARRIGAPDGGPVLRLLIASGRKGCHRDAREAVRGVASARVPKSVSRLRPGAGSGWQRARDEVAAGKARSGMLKDSHRAQARSRTLH